jgi:capsular exopolysaccharide synthesis family protein
LLYSTSKGLPQTLLVTSSQTAEGKSTTCRAMAIGFAKLGRKVLLIDVDMRRPSVHAIFGLENKAGLSSLLTQQDTIENVLAPSGFENLWVIPSGPIPPSPTDLLSSNYMSHLLEQLGQQFDLILLDSPPVMGLADAPLLAAIVQGVIVVIQADRSRRGSLKNTLRRLRGTNANILGGVLTMFDPAKAANRYSEYYSYNYNYYYYSDEKNA